MQTHNRYALFPTTHLYLSNTDTCSKGMSMKKSDVMVRTGRTYMHMCSGLDRSPSLKMPSDLQTNACLPSLWQDIFAPGVSALPPLLHSPALLPHSCSLWKLDHEVFFRKVSCSEGGDLTCASLRSHSECKFVTEASVSNLEPTSAFSHLRLNFTAALPHIRCCVLRSFAEGECGCKYSKPHALAKHMHAHRPWSSTAANWVSFDLNVSCSSC